MNLKDTQTLINYHYWARDRVLDAVEPLPREQFTREVGGSFGTLRKTLVHILWAECVWLKRWKGEPPEGLPKFDMFPDVATLRQAWKDQEGKLRAFFENRDEQGVQQVITYQNLKGQSATSPLWQMLQHVVNHASYHRGQVTTLLRQLDAAPPRNMDLITFYRKNT